MGYFRHPTASVQGDAIMAVNLINHNLNAPNKYYNPLYDVIKSCGVWLQYLDSSWFLTTYKTAKDIF